MSGYPNRAESEHDWIENSHASTALSYAHGIASGFALRGIDGERKVVAVVGDGALDRRHGLRGPEQPRPLAAAASSIVLNDNGRSYAPTVSQLSQSLTTLRLNPTYTAARERLRLRLRELPALGELAYSGVHSLTSALREMVAPHTFFEALGVRYAGPIDGHDIEHMEQAFTHAAEWDGPIVVHVLTQKGRGYAAGRRGRHPAPARRQGDQAGHAREHGGQLGRPWPSAAPPAPTAAASSSPGSAPERGDRRVAPARRHLHRRLHPRPAARGGGGPAHRGAHRGHARARPGCWPSRPASPTASSTSASPSSTRSTSAAGMAMAGLRPVVAVYSTFWSPRLRPGQPRRGPARLPGGLRARPGRHHRRRRAEPPRHPRPGPGALHPRHDGVRAVVGRGGRADAADRARAARALHHPRAQDGAAPRGPRRRGTAGSQARQLRAGDGSVCLLGVGKTVGACLNAADELAAEGIDATVWDVRVVSPPDAAMLADAARHRLVVTAEDGVRHGGAGAFLLDAMAAQVGVGGPRPRRRPGSSASRASSSPRARRTTSWPASASTAPASPRASAGSGSASRPSRAPTDPIAGRRLPLRPSWRRSAARSR